MVSSWAKFGRPCSNSVGLRCRHCDPFLHWHESISGHDQQTSFLLAKIYVSNSSSIEVVDRALMLRDELLRLVKRRLQHAQQCVKLNIKKLSCTAMSCSSGLVTQYWPVRLQPYRQNNVAHHVSHKLSRRYFPILDALHLIAYCIKLSTRSRIHNVFHVLKPQIGDQLVLACQLPPFSMDDKLLLVPLAILAFRVLHC